MPGRATGQPSPELPKATMFQGGNILPVPDPTALTTEALHREVQGLKELSFIKIDAIDLVIRELRGQLNQHPSVSVVEEHVIALKSLVMEKFSSVATEFSLRDIRAVEAAQATKVAVDAALQAAEKAVGKQNESAALAIAKSEASTVKSIDLMGGLLQNIAKANDDKVTDIKERFSVIETRSGNQLTMVLSILAIAISISAMIVVIFVSINHK